MGHQAPGRTHPHAPAPTMNNLAHAVLTLRDVYP